ncbi:hypothetical protein B0H14DRAFT_3860616 [Mycena olivaceomarginata]|nr:hypothetical protein B0H14DRAFT_3860616 [Mycena olivaceomarginata]
MSFSSIIFGHLKPTAAPPSGRLVHFHSAYTDESGPYATPTPKNPLPDPYCANRAAPSAADPYGVGAGRAMELPRKSSLADGGQLSVVERGRVRLPRGGGSTPPPGAGYGPGPAGQNGSGSYGSPPPGAGARGEGEGAAEGGESAATADPGDAGGGARVRVERRGEPAGERGGEYGVYGPRRLAGEEERERGRRGHRRYGGLERRTTLGVQQAGVGEAQQAGEESTGNPGTGPATLRRWDSRGRRQRTRGVLSCEVGAPPLGPR